MKKIYLTPSIIILGVEFDAELLYTGNSNIGTDLGGGSDDIGDTKRRNSNLISFSFESSNDDEW